jgi:large subunit ribosomal protein L15e
MILLKFSRVIIIGAYKYIQETIEAEYKSSDKVYKGKVRAWRRGPTMAKVERPTNLPRARRLGYKAKQGYVIVRIRMGKGRRRRPTPMGGRKPRHNYRFVQPNLSHQAIAEQKVNRRYKNLEVLNSYWVGEDGSYKFFEVILAEPARKSVVSKAISRKGKSFRGLTSQGKKARGLGRGRKKLSA